MPTPDDDLTLGMLKDSVHVMMLQDSSRDDVMTALDAFRKLHLKKNKHRAWVNRLVEENDVFSAFQRLLSCFESDEGLCKEAVRAICKLSTVEGSTALLIEYGMPELLTRVVRNHIMCQCIIRNAFTLLAELGVNLHIKDLFRINGGIDLISEVMTMHKNSKSVLDKAFYCLANLSVSSPENVAAMVEVGAVGQLLQGLQRFHADRDIIEGAMVTIVNICSDEAERQLVGKLDGARLMVQSSQQLTSSKDADLAMLCLAAIGSFSQSKMNMLSLLHEGAIDEVANKIIKFNGFTELQVTGLGVFGTVFMECEDHLLPHLLGTNAVAAILNVSRANPYNPDLQRPILAIMICLCRRLIRAEQFLLVEIRKFSSPIALSALYALPQHSDIVMMATSLLSRIVADESAVKLITKTNFFPTLQRAALRQAKDSHALAAIFNVLSELISVHTSATPLTNAQFLQVLADVLQKRRSNAVLLESTMTLIEHIARDPAARELIAPFMGPILIDIAQTSSSGTTVQMVAGVLGELALSPVASENLMELGIIPTVLYALQQQQRVSTVISALLDCLRKLMRGHPPSKKELERLQAVRLVDQLKFQHSGDNRVSHATSDFVRTLNSNDAPQARKHAVKQFQSSSVRLPELPQDVRLFLVAGSVLVKHCKRSQPHRRHVFVSPDLRFLVWRDPGKTSSKPQSLFLDICQGVERGCATKELQRDYKRHRRADPEKSFAVISKNRSLSLEAENLEQREQWADAISALLKYRQELNRLRDVEEVDSE